MSETGKDKSSLTDRMDVFNDKIQNVLDTLADQSKEEQDIDTLRHRIEEVLNHYQITVKDLASYANTDNISEREQIRKQIVEKLAMVDQEIRFFSDSTREKKTPTNLHSYYDFVLKLIMDQENEIYNFLAEVEQSLNNERLRSLNSDS